MIAFRPEPPRHATWLLMLVLPRPSRDDILGDLLERFHHQAMRHGVSRARRWYAREAWRFLFSLSRERVRDVAHGPGRPRSELMNEFKHDFRYAVRGMMARPAHTAAMIITMVLGIGATTAVFNVVNGVLLTSPAIPEPDRLVLVYEVDRRGTEIEDRNPVAAANFSDWRELNRSFTDMANFGMGFTRLTTPSGQERVETGWVSPSFFSVVGQPVAEGRPFTVDDGGGDAASVVILGHEYWQRRFGGDVAVVGSDMATTRGNATIVGIMPAGFAFLDRSPDIYYPWILSEQALQNRRSHGLTVAARLKPGISLAAAQADMDRVVAGLTPMYPEFLDGWGANVVTMEEVVVGAIRPALMLLLAAVGFLLLSAVVNLSNLLLMRGFAEHRGMVVRAALGAGRARLIRMRLIESGVLGLVGVVIGVPLAVIGTKALVGLAPNELPRVEHIGMDGRVLVFAAGITLITSVLAGLVPALRSAGGSLVATITESGRSLTGDSRQHRLHGVFTVTQLAFSLVLLVSAGLMMVTLKKLLTVETGYNPSGVATMKVSLPGGEYPGTLEQQQYFDRLLPLVQALPEVQHVGLTSWLPLLDFEGTWSVQIVGQPAWREGEKRDYGWHSVNAGYFQAMDMAIVRGRGFTDADRAGALPVVVVNEAFVDRFFPAGEDPLGQSMFVITSPDSTVRQIVGVVENVKHDALDAEYKASYYTPYTQAYTEPGGYWLGSMNLVVRTSGDPTMALRAVVNTVTPLDRNVLVSNRTTMADHVGNSVARERLAATLLNVFAGVALALALVGIYGVIAFVVMERRGEIGLRMALGAEPANEVRRFLKSGTRLIIGGTVIGLLGAMVFTKIQASLLYGVAAVDPVTYLVVGLGFVCLAMATTWLSARRASRVEPMEVLRGE